MQLVLHPWEHAQAFGVEIEMPKAPASRGERIGMVFPSLAD